MLKGSVLVSASYFIEPVEFGKFVESVTNLVCWWLLLHQPPHWLRQVCRESPLIFWGMNKKGVESWKNCAF